MIKRYVICCSLYKMNEVLIVFFITNVSNFVQIFTPVIFGQPNLITSCSGARYKFQQMSNSWRSPKSRRTQCRLIWRRSLTQPHKLLEGHVRFTMHQTHLSATIMQVMIVHKGGWEIEPRARLYNSESEPKWRDNNRKTEEMNNNYYIIVRRRM